MIYLDSLALLIANFFHQNIQIYKWFLKRNVCKLFHWRTLSWKKISNLAVQPTGDCGGMQVIVQSAANYDYCKIQFTYEALVDTDSGKRGTRLDWPYNHMKLRIIVSHYEFEKQICIRNEFARIMSLCIAMLSTSVKWYAKLLNSIVSRSLMKLTTTGPGLCQWGEYRRWVWVYARDRRSHVILLLVRLARQTVSTQNISVRWWYLIFLYKIYIILFIWSMWGFNRYDLS